MRVLDLFAGMGGWSQAFRDRGHEVVRVELDERYEAEIHANILDLRPEDFDKPFDLVLASPPCEKHSIMSVYHYWRHTTEGFVPKHPAAVQHTSLALHTLYLLEALAPKAAIMENPRGLMRKILPLKPWATVTYCSYGDKRMKPTDLWLFGAARNFYFKPTCRNGATCHERAPRSENSTAEERKQGTQGGFDDYWERSLVAYGLSLSVCEQMEQVLDGTLSPGRLAV